MQMFYSIDLENGFKKKSQNSFKPIFKCLNVTVDFILTSSPCGRSFHFFFRVFSDVVGNFIRGKIQNTHVIKYSPTSINRGTI